MKNILMNIEMTRAILNGRKSQTRRLTYRQDVDGMEIVRKSRNVKYVGKYKLREVLWVREPAKVINNSLLQMSMECRYLADAKTKQFMIPPRLFKNGDAPEWVKKCQGIPNGCIKEMARIFLKITDVRVQRLQDITFEDIFKEGFPNGTIKDFFITTKYKEKITLDNGNGLDMITTWWIDLWNKTAPKGYKWEDNPYVFVYEFKRVNRNGSDYE